MPMNLATRRSWWPLVRAVWERGQDRNPAQAGLSEGAESEALNLASRSRCSLWIFEEI